MYNGASNTAASPGREAASKQAAACLLDSRSYGCLAISPLMLPNGDIAIWTSLLFLKEVLICIEEASTTKVAGSNFGRPKRNL